MEMFKVGMFKIRLISFVTSLALINATMPAYAATVVIPDDTTVYLTTLETIVGKKNQVSVGQVVRSRVWRDVVVDGHVVLKGGTPAIAEVSSLKSRAIFGIEGKLSIAAIETTAVDGQKVYLTGGYHKEGGGRKLAAIGIGVLLFWPALFLLGKAAELPTGTVMDSFTVGSVSVALPETQKAIPKLSLGSIMSGFEVEILYEELAKEKKPKFLDFLITTELDAPDSFQIDVVNNEEIDPIDLETKSIEVDDENEEKSIRAFAKIKSLAKVFRKGINTFEVSYIDGEERVSEEVIFQVEI